MRTTFKPRILNVRISVGEVLQAYTLAIVLLCAFVVFKGDGLSWESLRGGVGRAVAGSNFPSSSHPQVGLAVNSPGHHGLSSKNNAQPPHRRGVLTEPV